MENRALVGVATVGCTAALVVAATLWLVLIDGASEASLRQLIRLSVDVAFPLFFVSFSASALHRFSPSQTTQYLMRNRRYIGLSFAALFLWHAGLIYSLARLYPEPFFSELSSAALYSGVLTFSVVALMAATSNDSSVKYLGRSVWSRLHRVLGYFVAVMFFLTYLGKLDQAFFWPFSAAALAVFVLRGMSRWLERDPQPT